MVNREPPPPEILTAAARDYRAMRHELAALLTVVRTLLAGHVTEVETVTDVWAMLLRLDGRTAAFIGATAVVQLAKTADSGDLVPERERRATVRVWGVGDGAAR